MACPHHVRQRKDSLEQRFISFNALRHDDQRTIGKEGTNRFGLSSIVPLSPNAAMQAVGVESFAAELAGAIGKGKRCDHPVSPLDGRNLRQRTSLFRFGEDLHGYIDCRYRARPSSIESQMREQLGKFVFADPILSGASNVKG